MKVGIVSLSHESNSFLSTPTTIDQFRNDILLIGEDIRRLRCGGAHEISGFFEGLGAAGIDAVPIFYASALPSGALTRDTCEELLEMMFREVERTGPMDGYLAAPHGAGTGDGYSDLDGYWLTRLREYAGPDTPIIFVMDSHCNLSPAMVSAANAGIAYRTNPHRDQKQCGLEAARLMTRTLRGEIKPVQAAAFPRIIIDIERQNTDEAHCRRLFSYADSMKVAPGVLSNSVLLGFPYTDVNEMGSAFLTVTDGEVSLAGQQSDALAAYLLEHRRDFVGERVSIEEAVKLALNLPGPVVLLDMGDNIGGGSAGDGTYLLHELHRRIATPVFATIYDPDSVAQAIRAGRDADVKLCIGGKTDNLHGPPLEVMAKVRSVNDGYFREQGTVHGGRNVFDMGRVVTVQTESKLTLNLTEKRVAPVSIGHMTSTGLHPKQFQIIIAKGVHSPIPAFEPYGAKFIRVDTSGSTSANLSDFTYHHRRRPLFPFEEIQMEIE